MQTRSQTRKKQKKRGRVTNPHYNILTRSQKRPIWCHVTQLQIRRLILAVGLGHDITMRDISSPRDANKLCDTLTNMLKCSRTRGWKVTKFLAAGEFGQVFRVVKNDGARAVMKVQVGAVNDIEREVRTQKSFHRKNLAPKIIAYCQFKPKKHLRWSDHLKLKKLVKDDDEANVPYQREGHLVHIILMEEIDGVVGNWLHLQRSNEQLGKLTFHIMDLVQSMIEQKLTHADLHLWNIGYVYTDASKKFMTLMPIDFGRSVVGHVNSAMDLCAILRVLHKKFNNNDDVNKDVHKLNRPVLARFIRSFAKLKFGISLPTVKDADGVYLRLFRKHKLDHALM